MRTWFCPYQPMNRMYVKPCGPHTGKNNSAHVGSISSPTNAHHQPIRASMETEYKISWASAGEPSWGPSWHHKVVLAGTVAGPNTHIRTHYNWRVCPPQSSTYPCPWPPSHPASRPPPSSPSPRRQQWTPPLTTGL